MSRKAASEQERTVEDGCYPKLKQVENRRESENRRGRSGHGYRHSIGLDSHMSKDVGADRFPHIEKNERASSLRERTGNALRRPFQMPDGVRRSQRVRQGVCG